MTTYRIENMRDLFKVPPEKRQACLQEIEYALALCELAGSTDLKHLDWVDDGELSVDLCGPDGAGLLRMKIEREAA